MGTNLLQLIPISFWNLTSIKPGYCYYPAFGFPFGFPLALTFFHCLLQQHCPAVCSLQPFASALRLSHVFCNFSRRSVFCIPTHRRGRFLGVVYPSHEFYPTNNSSKSYDFSELLLQTQPTTSTCIEYDYAASSESITFKISS
jgi:hypothetical protein